MSEVDYKRKTEMKRVYASGDTSASVLRSEEHLDKCLMQLWQSLASHADACQPIRIDEWFHYWSFDCVAELVLSGSFGVLDQGKDIGGSIANARSFMLYLSVTAHIYWLHDIFLGNPLLARLGIKPSQHVFDTTEAAVQSRRLNPDSGQDMIEQWTSSLRSSKSEVLKEEDLVQNAASTITAGSDTTATTMQAIVYYSLLFPDKLARLRETIDQAVEDRFIPASGPVGASASLEIKYLQAYIKEVLRIFPPVPSGLPRVVPKGGIKIGEQSFAEGVTISVNPHVFHRSRECFGPTADTFLPERWLVEDAKRLERYLIPFGAGYNSCPGRQVALIQVSKATTTLMRDFDFAHTEPQAPWEYKNWFTVVPHGFQCRVSRRQK